ncbi:hypothetical protein [Sphingomonas sp. 10B4]|uniref:hypothetical protein n=1 Tax=Sphingomonas sp. 10B4 TaxID=3048575 RepID=UPI002AB4C58C|nr:hypothetical protein [Sphingomonas sp. 10B4]MDY7524605.1 hypothetical protein [Sphingomonas sp. 10B4]MEB0282438.1 hypothetical protein [Sphingomonas sp. 10B4]
MTRRLRFLLLPGLLATVLPAHAASSSFDLIGPHLEVSVTHDGITLPLERVPNLAEGDRISVKLDLPPGASERYRVVSAFLRGAIDRPPTGWFHESQSWKPKGDQMTLTVPKGAQQVVLFISPESGGSAKAIIGTIRKQPGAFVRAVQELDQASLDRARLDAFLQGLQQAERKSPESVAAISPVLTRSLAIKLKAECLQQVAQVQAACLSGDRETLVLADSHSSALADTVTGTPTDLALQLSATPQAGYGAYSSYIGVVRDVFRLFGAFQSTQLKFIPALSQLRDGQVTVLLNTPLSFSKPTSVMVVALPLVEAPKPPPLTSTAPGNTLCATPGLVLPVEGAPLVYATGFAHDLTLRFKQANGTQAAVPLRADPSAGGFVVDGPMPSGGFGARVEAQVHGTWGFLPFDGPQFALSGPDLGAWRVAADTSLVVGRANAVTLLGDGVGCVTQVALRGRDGAVQPLTWKQSGPRAIVATVPLETAQPGPVALLIDGVGRPSPAMVTMRALQEAASIDTLSFRATEQEAVLTGTRLDQVEGLTLGPVAFHPGALARVGKQDRLTLHTSDPTTALVADQTATADIALTRNRHRTLAITVASAAPTVVLVGVTAKAAPHPGLLPITLITQGVFAQDAQLTFAFHPGGTATLTGRETVEIGTVDGRASALLQIGKGYDLQDPTTGIVTFIPAEALGALAYGPLRFRVVRDDEVSSWTPLAIIVRLPDIRRLTCARGKTCTLAGDRLFLIKALSATEDFRTSQEVPDGFIASDITTHVGSDYRLFLQLRDAPQASAVVSAR